MSSAGLHAVWLVDKFWQDFLPKMSGVDDVGLVIGRGEFTHPGRCYAICPLLATHNERKHYVSAALQQ